ncbi:MAG: hypothetical protein Q9227_008594 [Pyrenula ochraceoflavens]
MATGSLHYLPPVKPSAIALGTVFSHAADLAVMAPLFGDTYQRAKNSNSKEEFIKSKEAASAGAAYGSSLIGAGLQTYGVAALINATGTLSYKGAAYLGGLVFLATASPGIIGQVAVESRPIDEVAVGVVSRIVDTIGLSMFLTYWGTRTDPFN